MVHYALCEGLLQQLCVCVFVPLILVVLNTRPICLPLSVSPVGAVSLLIGLLNLLFAVDPRFKLEDPQYRQDRQKE